MSPRPSAARPSARHTPRSAATTSWERVSGWYKSHLKHDDFLQRDVVIPGTLELIAEADGSTPHLDIACGEGTFAEAFQQAFPRRAYVGADAAPTLIHAAQRKRLRNADFVVDDARRLATFPRDLRFGSASCILAIQNIDQPQQVFLRAAQVLLPGAPLVIVMNHPCFRQPRQSGWGWDEERKIQYRRIDRYLSAYEMPIIAHPGKDPALATPSFHHSVGDFVSMLTQAGFMIDAYEEWTSPAVSDSGPRAKAENVARREIPLFLAIRARLLK